MQLSAEARLRAAILLRDGLREQRQQLRRNGRAEPGWFAEVDAFADSLLFYEDDAVTGRKKLRAAASRRYRRRRAAERARQRDAGAA